MQDRIVAPVQTRILPDLRGQNLPAPRQFPGIDDLRHRVRSHTIFEIEHLCHCKPF